MQTESLSCAYLQGGAVLFVRRKLRYKVVVCICCSLTNVQEGSYNAEKTQKNFLFIRMSVKSNVLALSMAVFVSARIRVRRAFRSVTHGP